MAIFENAKKLNEEELKDASGGYIYNHMGDTYGWEVIDDNTGEVIDRNFHRSAAEEYCRAHGINPARITWEELEKLRGQ